MSIWGGKGKDQGGDSTPGAASTGSVGRPLTQSAIESTIGPNTHIKGNIQGDGGLRVDGIVEGTIELTGNLVVTESAKIKAEIKASNISVAGAIQGNVAASRVEILDTGRVWGDLTVKSLLINEGAYFRGQTVMPQDLQPPQLEAPKSPPPVSANRPGPQPGAVVDVEPQQKKK